MVRAKRVFAQVSQWSVNTLSFADTPVNAKDLSWFLERYPMEVVGREHLDGRRRTYEKTLESVQQLFTGERAPLEFSLKTPARLYQRQAADLTLSSGRLLLGDDVGLGKTASSICVISQALPAVVVTLTHLPKQWRNELHKFLPSVNVFIPVSGTPRAKDLELLQGLLRPDVFVLNYHKLAGWTQFLTEMLQPKTVVFDEIQELRAGRQTGKGSAASALTDACQFKMGLSATPVYNYGDEIFNILDILEPDCLGTREEFIREWCSWSSAGKACVEDPVALGLHLREQGLFLRRTGKDVKGEVKELDEPIIIPHEIDADLAEMEKVETDAAALARIILSTDGKGIDKMQASAEFDLKLRRATGVAKAPHVAAFVKMLLESEDCVLLGGWHHAVYAVWRDLLAEYNPVFFTGEESAKEKETAKSKFLSGESRVLIMSIRAGAGLDGLQEKCRTAVFGELDWSPGAHKQFVGRIWRPGQDDVVRAYYLHAMCGTDPLVMDVLGVKNAQQHAINDLDAPMLENAKDGARHLKDLAQQYLQRAGARQAIPA